MKKVIIWGHKLHSHTHSYIHYAFHKAFQFMGYNTYWMDDNDNVDGFNFSDSIFLTEGQVDKKIPVRNDCKYILHNCDSKYDSIRDNCLKIQVYTNSVLSYNAEKVGNFIYYDNAGKILYQYWATDLLPNEIEYKKIDRNREVYWVGTIGDGKFGNINELSGFIKGCTLNGINFIHKSGIDFQECKTLISQSYLAPAINGKWQVENGYIPCRIFKNISYGQFGLTNNKAVNDLFEGRLIYDENTFELFNRGKEMLDKKEYESLLFSLMNIVKSEHTYINRINTILKFL